MLYFLTQNNSFLNTGKLYQSFSFLSKKKTSTILSACCRENNFKCLLLIGQPFKKLGQKSPDNQTNDNNINPGIFII